MSSTAPGADDVRPRIGFRTMCGRQIEVGHLALGGETCPAHRVSLNISAPSGDGADTWVGLTADEAWQLSAALLVQAAACNSRPPAH